MPRTLTFGFALLHMRTPLRSWIIESERWKTLWFVGEFVALGAFGRQHNFDRVTGTDVAVASPRGAEHDSETVTERLNGGSHVHAVDGAVDPVVGLDTPHDVWIERHRDHDPIALTGGDDGRVGARLGHDRDDRPMVSAGRRECGGELRGGG